MFRHIGNTDEKLTNGSKIMRILQTLQILSYPWIFYTESVIEHNDNNIIAFKMS